MNRMTQKRRARRDARELRRAIDGASTPAMRQELIMISQRRLDV